MEKICKLLLLVSVLLSPLNASAEFYGQLGLGRSFNEGSIIKDYKSKEYKDSNTYSLAAGYTFPIPFFNPRAEIEYLKANPKAKDTSVTELNSLFLNGYVNVPLIPIVDPYIGLGVGETRFEHNYSPAVQGMLGVDFEIPLISTTIGGEYRYLKINETGGKQSDKVKYHANILMLKLRYSF
ncbi:MAG: outer membrane beta-barrel protein [Rhodospirillales bacterium]|nr:outer membrane beta-barrel protein [Rhodospirillales bacterium]MDO4974909.1 outer membrane beta-barrel protein [Alphaproteobacteria bacterium]